jgi:hypothetical protein
MQQSTASIVGSAGARKFPPTQTRSSRTKDRRRGVLRLAPIRTPRGTIVAQVIQEDGRRICTRRIRERDVFRELDGWAAGAFILDQCRHWNVAALRYVADVGIFEAPLDYFLANAIPREFANHPDGETQYILPRNLWPIRPRQTEPVSREPFVDEQLSLGLYGGGS